MSKPKERFPPFLRQCFVTCSVCCNIIGQGAAGGYPGVLLPQLKESRSIPMSKSAESWIASVMALSIFLGNMASPPLMGRLGRKAAAYAVIFTGMLGWTVLAFAPNVATLITGRFIQGVSYGIIMPLRPVLIAEYTSPKNRGSFLTTISLSMTIGIGLVHFIGSLLSWQYTALTCCFFPFISLLLTIYSPESPSWLALRGDYDKCRDAFRWLRGDGEEDELNKMIQTRIDINEERNTAVKTSRLENLKIIAKKKEVYKPVIIAMHVYLLAQLSGAITLPNFTPDILGALIGHESNFWMVELDVVRLITNILAVFVIAKINRRTMMFASGTLCILSHLGITVYACLNLQDYRMDWIPIMLLNLQMASIGFGMVPMANVISGEIFPLEYRSILGTVSVVAVAATMFLVLKTFPGLLAQIGLYGTYMVYCAFLTYGLLVTWFLLPETKGKTLQEIEEHFRGEKLPEDEPLRKSKDLEGEEKL